jgi:zinc D-Ala-D-Ala dipeptidase
MKREAAEALSKAQEDFEKDNYTIVVYDAYRPQMTVDYFVQWTLDLNDTVHKAEYYPFLNKDQLIPDYIAKKSGHTKGYSLDMTIAMIGSQIMNKGWYPRILKDGSQIYFLEDGKCK